MKNKSKECGMKTLGKLKKNISLCDKLREEIRKSVEHLWADVKNEYKISEKNQVKISRQISVLTDEPHKRTGKGGQNAGNGNYCTFNPVGHGNGE